MLQISKVEAINRIIQPLDGTIISTLDQPQNDSVLQAIRALDTVVEKIQIENQWNFNYDGPRTLSANEDNEILILDDYIYIRFHSWTNGSVWNLTCKDNKVWDRKQGTSVVGGQVEVSGTRKFSYDELDAPMQNYAIEYAKFEHLGTDTHLSAPRAQMLAASMRNAYLAAQKWDSEQKFGAMDISPPIRDTLRAHQSVGWWWS